MKVIAGCVIEKENKILMVKEAKKSCYGQWNYPAGHVEEFEKITEAAIRETFEETGCKVRLTGVLPISKIDLREESHILIRFTAELIEENICFDEQEILEVCWIDKETIKNMGKGEIRGYEVGKKVIKELENQHVYPLEILDNNQFVE